jgi:hypothetical protein
MGFHVNRRFVSVNLLAKYGKVGLSSLKRCGVVKSAVTVLHKKRIYVNGVNDYNQVTFTVRLR